MRKVQNSVNELNIGNVVRGVYLNSAMEEAIERPSFIIFRVFKRPKLSAAPF